MALDADIKTAVERIAQDVDAMRDVLEKIAGGAGGFASGEQVRQASRRRAGQEGTESLLGGLDISDDIEDAFESNRSSLKSSSAGMIGDLTKEIQRYAASGAEGIQALFDDVSKQINSKGELSAGSNLAPIFENLRRVASQIIPDIGNSTGKEFIDSMRDQVAKGSPDTLRLLGDLVRTSIGVSAPQAIFRVLNNDALESANAIRRTFGGVLGDTSEASNKTAASITAGLYAFRKEAQEAHLAGGKSLNLMVDNLETSFQRNVVPLLSESRILLSMGQEYAKGYGGAINEEIVIAAEGLGLGTEQIKTFIERNQALTGKANTDMLRSAGAAAQGVGNALGLAAKNIMPIMTEVIGSTERFGNVGVKEAARISSQVLKLGVDFRALDGVVSKMQGFESASDSVGKLTAAFGVNLDAMELMYLANEDQANLLPYLRDRFEEAGVDISNMSGAMKRLLSETLGTSGVQNVEKLLGDLGGNFEASQNAVAGSVDSALENTLESFRKTTEDMSSNIGNVLEKLSRMIEGQLTVDLAPALVKTIGQANEGAARATIEAFGKVKEPYAAIIAGLVKESEKLGESISKNFVRPVEEAKNKIDAMNPAKIQPPSAAQVPAVSPASPAATAPVPSPEVVPVSPASPAAESTAQVAAAASEEKKATAAAPTALAPQEIAKPVERENVTPINATINVYVDITEDLRRAFSRNALIYPEGAAVTA